MDAVKVVRERCNGRGASERDHGGATAFFHASISSGAAMQSHAESIVSPVTPVSSSPQTPRCLFLLLTNSGNGEKDE